MTELWAPVPGSSGQYEVSNQGRVRSLKAPVPRILRHQRSNAIGHRKLDLRIDGRRVPCWVHRLVMEAFAGTCPPGLQVRHLDGNPENNRLENLAYGTPSENNQDTLRHGRSRASQTECLRGHPLSGANLYVWPARNERMCRACQRERQRARKSQRDAIKARIDELKAEQPAEVQA